MSGELLVRQNEGWREGGRKIAPKLRRYSAAVVTSHDAASATFAALGISDAEAPYRSTIVVNLWGSSAIDRLLEVGDDAPGVSDCFAYGISLATAARISGRDARLSVIGNGMEPVDQFQVFRSRRWKAYAEHLLEAGSLLLLLAPAEAETIKELIAQVDGIVLVGINGVVTTPHARVIARIADPIIHREEKKKAVDGFPWRRTLTIFASLIFIAAAVAAGLKYFWLRQPAERPAPLAVDSLAAASSTPLASASSTAAIAAIAGLPAILNAADSAKSSRYSVEILAANTQSGAIFTLRKYRTSIPAGTVSAIPVGPDQALWYKVIGGAFVKREDADSLLVSLRRKRVIPDSAGAVVETPLAFLVDSIAAGAGMAARVRKIVDSLSKGGIPLYGLLQDDGSTRLYTGAFSNAGETRQVADQLRGAGITPVLVYRTGRNP